jgi:hypothetical protein
MHLHVTHLIDLGQVLGIDHHVIIHQLTSLEDSL